MIGTSSLEQVATILDEAVGRRDVFTGAQLHVSVDGEPLADVGFGRDGAGRPVSPDCVVPAYCAMKPVVASAVVALCERGLLRVDDRVGELLPAFASHWLADVTVAELLTHQAGLHEEEAVYIGLMTPAARRAMVAERPPPQDWSADEQLGYSVYAAWHVLGLVIERVSGSVLADAVRDLVLEPLGLTSEVFLGMSEEDYEANRERLRVNVDLQGPRPVPLLVERTDLVPLQWNPGFGGYTSMRGLGSFYEALLQAVDGGGARPWLAPATVRTMVSGRTPWRYDVTFRRACQYGYGTMVDMRAHHCGDACSAESFGHTGNVGVTIGLADPPRGLVVALWCNGLIDDPEVAFVLRRQVVGAVYDEVDRGAQRRTRTVSSG